MYSTDLLDTYDNDMTIEVEDAPKIKLTAICETCIELSWTAVKDAEYYVLEVQPILSKKWYLVDIYITPSAKVHKYRIDDATTIWKWVQMEPNNYYRFRVHGKNFNGAGPYSEVYWWQLKTLDPIKPQLVLNRLASGEYEEYGYEISWQPIVAAKTYRVFLDGKYFKTVQNSFMIISTHNIKVDGWIHQTELIKLIEIQSECGKYKLMPIVKIFDLPNL